MGLPLTVPVIVASVALSALAYCQEMRYFPDGAFRKLDGIDEAKPVALTLRFFGEKPLMEIKDKEREIYRVTSVGAWLDASSVRVERTGKDFIIVCHSREEYQGDRRRWPIMLFGERKVEAKDLDEVNKLFTKAGIRELPMRDDSHVGFDGATWVFEMLKDGRYTVVNRWSPSKGTPLHEIIKWASHQVATHATKPRQGERDGAGQPAVRPDSK